MNKLLIKMIFFLSLLGFCGAVLTIAYHHHDNAFRLRTCAICKVKASLSGSFNKDKIDSAAAAAMLNLAPVLLVLGLCGILRTGTSVFISPQLIGLYPNRAPPRR